MSAVITPKYSKTAWIFGIIGVMAKTLHGYWNGHPRLVEVAGLNADGVSIIKAEKCTQIDISYAVTINDDLPYLYF